MSEWLTTILILLPLAGALVVWLVPLPGPLAGSLALLVSLAEVGIWINALFRFEFANGLQFEQQHAWFGDLGVSYHVGMYGFSLWLIGLGVIVAAAAIAHGVWAGRDRARGYF